MKLQRLAAELLRHFGLRFGGGGGDGSGALAQQSPPGMTGDSGGVGGVGEEWQVLLVADPAAHGHMNSTLWGPVFPNDLTVGWGSGRRARFARSFDQAQLLIGPEARVASYGRSCHCQDSCHTADEYMCTLV